MKFVHPDINTVFDWSTSCVHTLVIENQPLFRRIIRDIYFSIEGETTLATLSINDKIVKMSKCCELISEFIHFDINRKTLLNKICVALEHNALSPECYLETQRLLSEIENKVSEWSFGFPCNITASSVLVPNLLKAIGVAIVDDYDGEVGDVEKIIDYMELVREFDCDKLFVFVNMRSYFSDSVVEDFLKTIVAHEFEVLMVESNAYSMLENEKRVTIDADLCEF